VPPFCIPPRPDRAAGLITWVWLAIKKWRLNQKESYPVWIIIDVNIWKGYDFSLKFL
jgi:hypothetical protein